ncbi:MAG: hypothetical protein EDM82_00610 [Cyanobacteria bacterium CYA]|nr:MAG: hypothetical protein EDM82_00610 [Cyanobacteria bacterium CYA]
MGLLVGTATVGSVSLMMGQSDARRPGDLEALRPGVFDVSHSPDGRTAYLWGIDPEKGTMRLLGQQALPNPE